WAGQDAGVIGAKLLLIGILREWRNVQELTRASDVVGAVAIGKQAIVPDAVKAFGEDVHEEATNKFVGVERHRLPAIGPIETIILPAKPDATVVGANEAAVGNGYAMGVAGHISQDGFGSGERLLGI